MSQAIVVGITGGSGSGKTTFVRELKQLLGEKATLFSQDEYYYPVAQVPVDDDGVHNFDLPQSIDSSAMAADIKKVLAGESVQRSEYIYETAYCDDEGREASNARPRKTITFAPAPIILIEGLFSLHEPALSELMDLQLFIEVTDVAKLSRRIKRDRLERGLPLEDVLFRYEAHVLPAYRQYIEPYRQQADLVINNQQGFERGLNVISSYLLSQIPATVAS